MKTIVIILLLLVQCVLIIYTLRILATLLFLIIYHKKELPFVPSVPIIVRMMARSGYVHDGDHVVDLGCGTGTLLVGLAWRFKNSTYVGVEQAPLLATVARIRTFFLRKRIDIVCGDMFDLDISHAQVIVGFWVTELMPRIVEKIVRECAQGTRIMSHMFPLPEHPQLQLIDTLKKRNHVVRVYRVQG